MNLNALQAVPLTIVNVSDVTMGPDAYEAHAYLGLYKDGGTCADDAVLYFVFEPGATLQINDGSFIYNSPLNNYSDCLASLLGDPSCSSMPLDWDGQRFWLEAIPGNPYNSFYPAGLIGLSSGGIECEPSSFLNPPSGISYTESLNDYELKREDPNDSNEEICKISYKRYGNTLAILSYE